MQWYKEGEISKGNILLPIKYFYYILENNLEGMMLPDTTSPESLLQGEEYPWIMNNIFWKY